jgi:hypothetical protein
MFHILYRYNYTRNPTTIRDHVEILNEKGEVWWGVFGKGISESRAKDARNQISTGMETRVILSASNMNSRTFHVANLKDVVTKRDPWFPSNASELIPSYYRGNEILTWFKLDSIEEAEETILQQYVLQSSQKPISLRGQAAIMYIVERIAY